MPVNEEWITGEQMAEAIKKAKGVRKSKLGAFTRSKKRLQTLIDGEADKDTLNEAYTEVADSYRVLEQSHEALLVLLGEDSDAEDSYLDEPSEDLSQLKLKVTKATKERDAQSQAETLEANRKKEFDSMLASFKANVQNFGKPSSSLLELSTAKVISFADMRLELEKVEAVMTSLQTDKDKITGLGPSEDLTAVYEQYNNLVVDEVSRCKRIALEYVKDAPVTEPSVVTGGGGVRAIGYSATKRETVMLPQFSGDEKTAFLKYPVWKLQWDAHITEYEQKYRATMLHNHLDSKALEQIVGLENDYDRAITQLDKYYNDSKKIIKACLDEVRAHPVVNPFDYKGLVSYKKCLTNNHTRLKACGLTHEMSNTAALTVLIRKFPIQEVVKWQEFLAEQDKEAQTKPFPSFIKWLEKAGASWELLAASGTGTRNKSGNTQVHHSFFGESEELDSGINKKACFKCGEIGHWKKDCKKTSPSRGNKTNGGGTGNSTQKHQKDRQPPKNKKYHCAYHKDAPGKLCSSWSCVALKYAPVEERLRLLEVNGDCKLCCGDCPRGSCQAKVKRTCGGNKDGRGCGSNHLGHELWCKNALLCFTAQVETVLRTEEKTDDGVLLQVMRIPSISPQLSHETVLWDTACTGRFVRHNHARRMGFPFQEKRLKVTMLGGAVQEVDGVIYNCRIKDQSGKIHHFTAHGLDHVTGSLGSPLEKDVLRQMFPDIAGVHRLSGAEEVDYLIGIGNASWQPERVQQALGGGDFWVWENKFGSCIGGSHPLVNSFTRRSDSLYTVLKVVVEDSSVVESLRIPTCTSLVAKTSCSDSSDFFAGEQLGTIVEPKCGSCRCGKCPIPGSRYSYREETELKLIEDNLKYDEEHGYWLASYPYLYPRETLRGTKEVAYKSMMATEKTLSKKGDWGKTYQEQITDMISRGVVRLVPEEELVAYKGHVNYLPHLAAINPRSASTPVRICFDASRLQGGGPSLNDILAKGPDRFLNNLAGVILNFRNGRVAVKGDVRKMYNCIRLVEEDAYVQCFLWRDLDPSKKADTYQVVVNNIGVKPAGAIATLCLQKSSDLHSAKFPITARQLKEKSYVDDLGLTAENMDAIRVRTKEADIILKHANMSVKKWVYSGSHVDQSEENSMNVVAQDHSDGERMLGIIWDAERDVFRFLVRINLSPLKNKSRVGPDLSKSDLMSNPPEVISRRQYYSQVQSFFDPIGLLAPVLLKAKLILRKTWEGDCQKLKWDDPLPEVLVKEIIDYFIELFELETLVFPRSLWPKEETVGDPDLVCFSDGSISAFGTVIYIRWRLVSGKWWTSLVTAKSKIAPKNRITIPRLELNGAVLAKRLREFVVAQVDLKINNIYHLVDSSTVLGYLHKQDSRLKPFEGVRVSEIQAAGIFLDGRLDKWSWIDGDLNPADWATKPRVVADLVPGGFWQIGPSFIREDTTSWPTRLDFKIDRLEGELLPKVHLSVFVCLDGNDVFSQLLDRVSSARKLFRVMVHILKLVHSGSRRSFDVLSVQGIESGIELKHAVFVCVKLAQREVYEDMLQSISSEEDGKVHGRFKRLAPFLDENGIWRVGHRMTEYTPFTADHRPPMFLPPASRLTVLLMREAHEKKHSGISETLAQFRMLGYWTTHAAKLAKSIRTRCVTCRYLDKTAMKQKMGSIPGNQLMNPVAWGHVEMDLFGPFRCRSEINKRASCKVWCMVLVDRCSGATHCDIVMDYSAQETIKTLRRFASLRGWPVKLFSDPGSQLESSSGSLESWWTTMKDQLSNFAAGTNFSWEVSPANSPWRQGKSEVRIKVLKRLITIAVGSSRLTPSELQTVIFEAANLCNERPIGVHRVPKSDGSFQVLTPNSLLIGRSLNKVPDDSELALHLKKSDRFQLIQQITMDFWTRWTEEVTPESIVRQRWHETGRNIQVGDVVLIHEKSPIKGKYKLGLVESVKVSHDGLVRSCAVGYRTGKDSSAKYSSGKKVTVTRSVQRLTLLLPVEEQNCRLEVVEDQVTSDVKLSDEKI